MLYISLGTESKRSQKRYSTENKLFFPSEALLNSFWSILFTLFNNTQLQTASAGTFLNRKEAHIKVLDFIKESFQSLATFP